MSYRVDVRTIGDPGYYSNGLRFRDQADAESYAVDLSLRWLAVEDYRIVESMDEPNR
ncbi:MAG: hypothetical protein AB2L22_13125 [Syntrophales bacterium]